MSEQAPAGWYPVGHGDERYWDGARWTDQVRQLAGEQAAVADSTLTRLGSSLRKKAADRRASKEDLAREQAERARAAGSLVTSGVFGTSTVEIYSGGYVRVAAGEADDERPKKITSKTPYEKLMTIKCTLPKTGTTPGSEMSGLMKGAASLVKGGAGIMKASVPGMVVAGLSQVAAAEANKAQLTIATDLKIHTLTNQRHNGFMKTSVKVHNDVALALEAAGNAVLGERADPAAATPSATQLAMPSVASPTVSDRIRELASLHQDGILSDDEFAAAKAKVLDGL